MLLDNPAILVAVVLGNDVLGLDDRRVKVLELRFLSRGLFVELGPERGELGSISLGLRLELGQFRGLVLDRSIGFEDLVLELADGGLVVGNLVLKGLVLVVLLNLVELDRQVVNLGLMRLERVLAFLDLDLRILECLTSGLEVVSRLTRAAWRAASNLGPEVRRSRRALAR